MRSSKYITFLPDHILHLQADYKWYFWKDSQLRIYLEMKL